MHILIILTRFIPVSTGNTNALAEPILPAAVHPCDHREHSKGTQLILNEILFFLNCAKIKV